MNGYKIGIDKLKKIEFFNDIYSFAALCKYELIHFRIFLWRDAVISETYIYKKKYISLYILRHIVDHV